MLLNESVAHSYFTVWVHYSLFIHSLIESALAPVPSFPPTCGHDDWSYSSHIVTMRQTEATIRMVV